MPSEELLARVDERTLALQKSVDEIKKTQTESVKELKKTQEGIWDKLDSIEGKISENANKCPLGEDREKAHAQVVEDIKTLKKEQDELRGGRRVAYIIAGAGITIVGIIIGFFI